ncbi:MAG: primosomal protein N' [Chloroflexota bacterium]|nr:primosomal protein N' [Chloroflexota bacterium]
MFADIVVFSPVKTPGPDAAAPTFTYHLPHELQGRLAVGSLVVVPFGPRRLYGVVVAFSEVSPVPETRPVESLVDPDPVLTPAQISLARWMSREYLAPLHECLELILPPGVAGYANVLITLNPEPPADAAKTDAQAALLALLRRRGPLRGTQVNAALRGVNWRAATEQLARRGVVTRQSFLAPPRARPHQVRTARLIPTTNVDIPLPGLRSEVYPVIIKFLHAEGGPVDISWVYAETGCTHYHLDKLAQRGLVALEAKQVWRDPLAGQVFVPTEPPPLTPDQAAVWEKIRVGINKRVNEERDPSYALCPSTHLLHGVTGSGKTEIYLRAVAEVLPQGRRATILVPEISLTPQTVARFAARFPGRVAVLHSALTKGERYDTWRRARAGLVDIVIGPRSALFAPLSPLGLIVLDEEHDDSYKQDGPRPRYHTRAAALELGRLTGATVILGSATPSLESYQRARRGEFTLLEMGRRIMGHTRRLSDLQARHHIPHIRYHALRDGPVEACYMDLPPVQVVDLRAELRAGNRSIFSRALQQAMGQALGQGEQVILFLNRRGTATFILCRDCGYVVKCPHCDTPLTYHGPRARLICHHCNHRESQPNHCPQCGRKRIRYFGLGTERVETAVQERWPDARLLRWDRDTARSHAAHTNILQRFVDGAADVLIGTQMIAKGLDLPRVTVVGIISADTALNLPDFRSGERTFQLLTQVAGRAGRGLLGGRVILQTYNPNHYAVLAAAAHNYAGFATRELAFRREQGYPPYRRLAKLVYENTSPSRAQAEAKALAESLCETLARRGLPATDLIGPAPPFFARLRGRYRWQIILRHSDPAEFLRSVQIPPGWRVDVDPVSVL